VRSSPAVFEPNLAISSSEGNSLTTETTTNDTSSTEETNPCQRELTIEIPADVVKAETDSIVNKYQKLARVPGFRKGKVPASMVRQRFAEDIKSEIVDALPRGNQETKPGSRVAAKGY
jgi:hypothetical protein